jgi:two-component system sensor histidine kinase AtoS
MSENTGFPMLSLGGTRPLRNEELESLIEQLPHAAILVDVQSWRVLMTNARFGELTAYTRGELSGLEIRALLPEWQPGLAMASTPEERPATSLQPVIQPLVRRNRTRLNVQIMTVPAGPRLKNLLVIAEAADPARWPFEQQRLRRLWNGLNEVIGALQVDGFEAAINGLLKASGLLTNTKSLAVYRLQENNPQLRRCASLGPEDLFPEHLSAQDLAHLSRPKVWEAGKRPSSMLHQSARAAGMAFLASAPIGQANAIVGVVAIGDEQPADIEFVEQAARLVAGAATVIFQRHAWGENLQARLIEQSAQTRFAAAIEERVREGILTLGPELQILRMNPAVEIMMGYAENEVVGQPVEKVLIGPEGLMPALIAAQQGNPTYNLGSAHLYRRNGEAFLALVRIFPVTNEGKIEQIIVFIEDLSEQEQIRLHTQQLEHRALLGEVTAIFAHEVRNPINNISTGLQLMALNLLPDDPGQENITRMMQDCDRLAELIKSVLAFSRPADYEMEPLDLTGLLQHLLERLRPRIARLNVDYQFRIEPECPPIRGNLRALEQVFSNLITNALQAMGEQGGNLFIKVQPVHQDGHIYVEVSVADTGPGIPKELQERVFQPFFTTERGGTGLGLAIAKRIITAHKGTIRLTSFPGGTIFHVQIPQDEA